MHISLHLRLAALVVAALLLAGIARAQTLPAADWAVTCGSGPATYPSGSSGPAIYPFGPSSLAVDGAGNVYVLGSFTGTVTLGPATLSATQTYAGYTMPADYYLAKLSAQGQYLWAVQLGDGQSVQASQVAADNLGNVYLTGSFSSYSMQVGASGPVLYNSSNNSEGFVARFSGQSGQCQWARRFGGTGADGGSTLAMNTAGELFLAGDTGDGAADLGTTMLPAAPSYSTRGFLAKLSPAGTWLWAQQVGSNGRASTNTITLDGQGGLYLSGYFEAPGVTLGTAVLVTTSSAGCSLSRDAFVAKYTDTGAFVWATQGAATGRNDTYGGNLLYDGQGHLYTAGSFTSLQLQLGSFVLNNASQQVPPPIGPAPPVVCTNRYFADAYVARLDATTGTWQWATQHGASYTDDARIISLGSTGRILLDYYSATTTSSTQQIIFLDATGSNWTAAYTLPTKCFLQTDQLGRLYLFGSFTAVSLPIAGQTIPGAGTNRNTGFVIRLGQVPLATQSAALTVPGLQAWPTPGPGTSVWVQGAKPGQTVEVLDMLGRRVGGGTMPASGPLHLSWANAGLAPGVYVLRSGLLSCRWVVE